MSVSNVQPLFTPVNTLPSSPQNTGGAGDGFDSLLADFGGNTDSGPGVASQGSLSSSLLSFNPLDFLGGSDSSSDNSSNPLDALVNGLVGNIQNMLQGSSSGQSSASTGDGFTPQFQATFGNSGPLIDYINMITAQLNLTPAQNLAVQNISVEHKDTTGSQQDIQQIAQELTAAGIQSA